MKLRLAALGLLGSWALCLVAAGCGSAQVATHSGDAQYNAALTQHQKQVLAKRNAPGGGGTNDPDQ